VIVAVYAAYLGAGVLVHWFLGRGGANDPGEKLREEMTRALTRRRLHLRLTRFRYGLGAIVLSGYATFGLVSFLGHERHLNDWCSFYVFATVFIFLLWSGFRKQRRHCAELQKRIVELEKLRVAMDADGENPVVGEA